MRNTEKPVVPLSLYFLYFPNVFLVDLIRAKILLKTSVVHNILGMSRRRTPDASKVRIQIHEGTKH